MQQRSSIGGVALLVAGSFVLLGPAAEAAAPDSPSSAGLAAQAQHLDSQVPAGWTGSSSGCAVGSESQESLSATTSAINRLRSAAGTGPITLDPALNSKALAAALMMRAESALSHYPGPGWACYSADGSLAAGRSNLYLGRSGAEAMLGYLHDEGVASLGHRRWLLNPQTTVMGSGSTGETNALWVVSDGPDAPVPSSSRVAWPAAGYVVDDWVPSVWSLAVGGPDDVVTAESLQVSMTLDGSPIAVSQVATMGQGYGAGQTLRWTPQLGAELAHETRLDVTISGVTVNGSPTPISYSVIVIPWEPAGTDPTATPEQSPGPTPSQVVVKATAISRAGKMLVDIDPNLRRGNWTFTVHRMKANGAWRKVRTLRTRGSTETRTVNLPKGRYVVRVAGRNGHRAGESAVVTLVR